MSTIDILKERSNNSCELCKATDNLSIYNIPPQGESYGDAAIFICKTCLDQLEKKEELNASHWSCLRDSMWSEVIPVQVVSWRLLNRLKNETWAADLIDQMYLEDDNLEWAKATGDHLESDADDMHRDSNGVLLRSGDSVTLIKSLDVKGSQINAKIGTVVKNIKIVSENSEQIEGKIEGQSIIILTKFVRKSS
jgi:protein PhnA